MTGTSLLPLDTLAGTIKAHIAAGDKAVGKAEEHYKAAGIHLLEARDRVKREGVTFSAFLVGQCGLGRSRAYELIAIADGTKTLADIRATAADRAARHADKNRAAREASVSNGQPEDDADDGSEVATLEVVIDNLLHSIGGMNESARVFNKVLKASTFDQDAVTKINTAIDRMIKKWGSIQSVLGVTTPVLSGADVKKLNEKLDAGLRLVEAYSNDSALQAAQAEVDQLIEENERLRDAGLHQDDRANEVASRLIEMYDAKRLTKINRMLGDHLRHPERTPFQRSVALGFTGLPGANGRPITKTELAKLHSFRVEVTDTEGKRWRNDVRLNSEEEARIYLNAFASRQVAGYVAGEVVRVDGEIAFQSVTPTEDGDVQIGFMHGTCSSFEWRQAA